jgi:hypothetical protein
VPPTDARVAGTGRLGEIHRRFYLMVGARAEGVVLRAHPLWTRRFFPPLFFPWSEIRSISPVLLRSKLEQRLGDAFRATGAAKQQHVRILLEERHDKDIIVPWSAALESYASAGLVGKKRVQPTRRWTAKTATLQLVIEHDQNAGYYLFVYPRNSAVPTADHLQDSLQTSQEVARQKYGVPDDAWEEMPERRLDTLGFP